MFEAVFLILLVVGVVWAIRGKPSAPLVIHQPGQFHATLAPPLAHLQGLFELIARQFAEPAAGLHELATQYFEVIAGAEHFLLAVALRQDLLYFQAIFPQASRSSHLLLSDFSSQVMVHHPLRGRSDPAGEHALQVVAEAAAAQFKMACKIITD